MTEKRSFSDDWSAFSDEQVMENIKYLLEHYKEYDVYSKYRDSHLIVDNVDITKFETLYDGVYCYSINNKWYGEIADKSVLDSLANLMDVCYEEAIVQEAKRSKKRKRNTTLAIAAWMILMSVLAGVVFKQKAKKAEIKNKQYEKTLPDNQNYEQKQQQIANYRDSLRSVSK